MPEVSWKHPPAPHRDIRDAGHTRAVLRRREIRVQGKHRSLRSSKRGRKLLDVLTEETQKSLKIVAEGFTPPPRGTYRIPPKNELGYRATLPARDRA